MSNGLVAAIYARVSTDDQDESRQIKDCQNKLDDIPYEIDERRVFADVMTGTTTDRDEYLELVDDVRNGEIDVVIATEVSRLSRSGAQDVMQFITTCLENGTSVLFTQSPVELRIEMDEITKSIQRTIISLLSELANVEHKQKMERIQSGIQAAQSAGKWTGRPPRGFTVDHSGRLVVEPVEFLNTRRAVARVVAGESPTQVSEDSGIPEGTLRSLRDNRRELYLGGDADDDRVEEAVESVKPLPDIDIKIRSDEIDELVSRIDEIKAIAELQNK